ncbi:MAG: sterol desaturase family protein, partial [Candidatus Tectomicrobia bacterium]
MEALIRLGIFLGIFAIMTGWEVWRPRRTLSQSKARRWLINLALTVLDTLVVRLTVGAVAVSAAVFAQQRGWGLLPALHVPG